MYYLSNVNFGNIEFGKLMTEWRNERRIKSNVGPNSYLLPLTVLKRLYSKFSFLCLPLIDSPRLTLGNPNPKEDFTLSAFRTVAPSNFSLGVWGEVFPLYPSPTSMIPWKQNIRRYFLNDDYEFIRFPFLP